METSHERTTTTMDHTQLVPMKDGKPVSLQEAMDRFPGLRAFADATRRALISIDEEAERIEAEIEELTERIALHEELEMPTRGPKALRTRRQNQLEELRARQKAHESGYLEVPDMGGRLINMDANQDLLQEGWPRQNMTALTESLGSDVPIDVLRALRDAKEAGVFDAFRVYLPSGTRTADPVVVGMAGGRPFYVASWS